MDRVVPALLDQYRKNEERIVELESLLETVMDQHQRDKERIDELENMLASSSRNAPIRPIAETRQMARKREREEEMAREEINIDSD